MSLLLFTSVGEDLESVTSALLMKKEKGYRPIIDIFHIVNGMIVKAALFPIDRVAIYGLFLLI